jgi:hypothetical protein
MLAKRKPLRTPKNDLIEPQPNAQPQNSAATETIARANTALLAVFGVLFSLLALHRQSLRAGLFAQI